MTRSRRVLRPRRRGGRRRLLLVAAVRHPHRRRRDRGGRRALRRARSRRRRARPDGFVGLALPRTPPAQLTVLGMNEEELAANPQASATVVHDLNRDPRLPFDDDAFDAAVCCVSVDYLTRPVEVFAEVARVVRAGGAVRLHVLEPVLPDQGHPGLAGDDRRGALQHRRRRTSDSRAAGTSPIVERRTPPLHRGDPLFAVLGPPNRLSRARTALPLRSGCGRRELQWGSRSLRQPRHRPR